MAEKWSGTFSSRCETRSFPSSCWWPDGIPENKGNGCLHEALRGGDFSSHEHRTKFYNRYAPLISNWTWVHVRVSPFCWGRRGRIEWGLSLGRTVFYYPWAHKGVFSLILGMLWDQGSQVVTESGDQLWAPNKMKQRAIIPENLREGAQGGAKRSAGRVRGTVYVALSPSCRALVVSSVTWLTPLRSHGTVNPLSYLGFL